MPAAAAAAADFPLDAADGSIAVREAGVYLVYAQVTYLNGSDVNSFVVAEDGVVDPFLSCSTSSITTAKSNTCFTSGARFLSSGARVSVRDVDPSRRAVMLPAQSYFGMVQLAVAEQEGV